jgi:hypothetical protein
MLEWEPIAKATLLERIAQGAARMSAPQLRLWETIRIEPTKWQQHPYGDQGAGFWVVAIIGSTVIWYNDIEDGFNRSRYSTYGIIDDYWCNQDELELTVQYLMNAIGQGSNGTTLSHSCTKVLLAKHHQTRPFFDSWPSQKGQIFAASF